MGPEQPPGPPGPQPPPPPPQGLPSSPYSPAPGAWTPPPKKKENVLGIVGLVCAIAGGLGLLAIVGTLGILFFIGFFSVPLSIAGLVCGYLGKQKVSRGELETGAGISQAAFIVGLVSIILHVLAAIVFAVVIGLIIEAADDADSPRRDGPRGLDETAGLVLAMVARWRP